MLARLLHRLTRTGRTALQALRRRLLAATTPSTAALIEGTLADLVRSKPELVAENALLRQQLLILRRSVQRPRCTPCVGYLPHPPVLGAVGSHPISS